MARTIWRNTLTPVYYPDPLDLNLPDQSQTGLTANPSVVELHHDEFFIEIYPKQQSQ